MKICNRVNRPLNMLKGAIALRKAKLPCVVCFYSTSLTFLIIVTLTTLLLLRLKNSCIIGFDHDLLNIVEDGEMSPVLMNLF